MASPQKENGFIPIANEIAQALAKINLSPYESRILWIIFRKTYGWQKKTDKISLSQFKELTNIPISHICRSLKKMVKKQIITQIGKGYYTSYSFQKNYHQWKPLPKQVTLQIPLPEQVITITQTGNKPLPEQADTKETNTKETNTCVTPKTGNTADNHLKSLFSHWGDVFKAQFRMIYPMNFGKEGKILKDVLKLYGLETAKDLITVFFDMCKHQEWLKDKINVGVFRHQLPKVIVEMQTNWSDRVEPVKPTDPKKYVGPETIKGLIAKTAETMQAKKIGAL